MQISWSFLVIFIVIILLIACIVCVAAQNTRPSPPQRYVRTGPQAPWVPLQEPAIPQRKWESAYYQADVRVCSCGKWNNSQQTRCWQCKASLSDTDLQTITFETAQKCAVCNFDVFPGDPVVLCPACHAQGHRAHMLEYFKAKGRCPVCSTKFSPQQLLETVPSS